MSARRQKLRLMEQLEPRHLLANDWTNPFVIRDVSDDGVVVPLDALILINELNEPSIIDVDGALPDIEPGGTAVFFYDVNCDGFATPTDALIVINALNDDDVPPTITAALLNDTAPNGVTNSDGITAVPTFTGQITDELTGVSSVQLQVDSGPLRDVSVDRAGQFTIDPELALDGSNDGEHLLTFFARDGLGNSSGGVEFTFFLDTIVPDLQVTSLNNNDTLRGRGPLSGTASGTGSELASASYQFDDANEFTLPLVGAEGSFEEPLATGSLTEGPHNLSLELIDTAGNVTTQSIDFNYIPNLSVIGQTPVSGATEVGVTVRPQVFFSRPVDTATLSSDNFFASQSGEKLPATIVPANDGRFAWLFFDEPMPSAAAVQVTLDGSTIEAVDGEMLDADGDGLPGGTLQFDFRTVSLVPVAGTSLSGIVADPGPDLEPMTADDFDAGPDGEPHTDDDIYLLPIEGASIHIIGVDGSELTTGADGRFQYDAAPVGNVKLAVDGQTASNPPAETYFPEMVMDVNLLPGQNNFAMAGMETVYLPRIRSSILTPVDSGSTSTINTTADGAPNLTEEQRQFLTLEVQPNSLVGFDGQSLSDGMLGISTVPPELVRDMLPPGVLQHTFDITVQAPGISNLSQPAPMTFPNMFDAPPGSQLNFLSFDHNTGRLVIEGTATVSEDGNSVSTDPGTGITHPGWHGLTPPGGCGGSGGDPPMPVPPAPNEEVTIHDPVALDLMTGDTPVGSFPGFTWQSPPENPDAPPLPPIPGCNVPRHNPNDNDQQPFVNVTIEVDGPLAQFGEAFGADAIPLQSQAFTLSPGTNETKRFDYFGKSYDDLFPSNGFKDLQRDRLYGARIKITKVEQFSDGRRTRDVHTYYQYRWVDVVDPVEAAARTGDTAVFHKTLADGLPVLGGGFVRHKFIDGLLPSSVTTNFDESFVSDFEVNDPVQGNMSILWNFDPTSAGEKTDAIDIEVADPQAGTLVVGQLQARGTAIEPSEINVNIAGYQAELKRVILALRNAMVANGGGPGAAGDDDGNGSVGNEEYGFPGVAAADVDTVEVIYPYAADAIVSAVTVGDDGMLGTADDVTRDVIGWALGANGGWGSHAGPDNMAGNADDETFIKYAVVGDDFKAEFAGFMPADRQGAGPDGMMGTGDDVFTAAQLTALDQLLVTKANELKEAIAADYEVGNQLAEAYKFVDAGGDVTMTWQDSFVTAGDAISTVSGSVIYGFADFDRNTPFMQTHLSNNNLPIGAKMYVLAEGLNPTVANQGSFGVAINTSWTSFVANADGTHQGATFAEFVANTVSHEIGHTFGMLDAYANSGPVPGTAGCDANLNCIPFDLMRSGNDADGDLTYLNENTKIVQAAMGAHSNLSIYLIDAVEQYKKTFNLAGSVNGIREQIADIEFGDQSPRFDPIPLIAVNTDDSTFAIQEDVSPVVVGSVAADGAGGEQTQLDIELVNVGLGPLTINSIDLTDGATGFSADAAAILGQPIAPDERVQLTIVLDPDAEGALADTLVIESDAVNIASFSLPLEGTGLAPHAQAQLSIGSGNNFGAGQVANGSSEIPDLATIENVGTQTLEISGITLNSGLTSFSLLGVPADLAVNPLQLQAGETFTFGAAFHPSSLGLNRALIDITTNDPDNPTLRTSAVGTGILDAPDFDWANDFIALETPDIPGSTVLRTMSDEEGNFEIFIPSDARYHLVVFDPESGLVSHSEGITAPSGQGTDLTSNLVFSGSVQNDSDFEGVPDDIEFAIGSSLSRPDTDLDGLDDFSEIEQGLDPLGGVAFPTGIVASMEMDGEAREIIAVGSILDPSGQTLYVATGSHGLAIADGTQLTMPILLGQLQLAGNNDDVAVDPQAEVAALTGGPSGLHLVDVSDPMLPVLQQTVNLSGGAQRVEIIDGLAMVASGANLVSVDIATGDVIQTLELGSEIRDIALEGSRLFALRVNRQLTSVDVDRGLLVARGSLELPTNGQRLFVGNNVAYIASEGPFLGGFATVDVVAPDALQLLSDVDDGSLAGKAIAANGSGLAVSVGSPGGVFGTRAIDVIDVSDPTDTGRFVTRFEPPSGPLDVALASGIAFVAAGASGLQVVNYLPFDVDGNAPTVDISTSAADVDEATAGLQLVAGAQVPILVEATDDVQVRNVELLVNGQVVLNDVSFPFDLQATLPSLTAGQTEATLQVRATDTGGNVTLSNEIIVDVVPDTVAPELSNLFPADGQTVGRSIDSVRITLSEPVAAETVSNNTLRLLDSSGNQLLPDDLGLRSGDRVIQLSFDDLPVGDYQLEITSSAITDRAGNALGTEILVSSFTKSLATIQWINPAGGSWHVASNWDLERLPGPADDVLIDLAEEVTVTVSTGNHTIRSLLSNEDLVLSGGRLGITDESDINGTYTQNGGTIDADGPVFLRGGGTWNGGTVEGTQGLVNASTLEVAGGANKTLVGLLRNTATIIHSGDGDVLVSPGGTLTNDTTGVYDFQGDDGHVRVNFGTTSTFNNLGTVRKSAGVGVSSLNPSMLNLANGTVDAQSGTLAIGELQVFGDGAILNAGNGAFIDLTGGRAPAYSGLFTGDGEGFVQLSQGTLNVGEAGATFDFEPGVWRWLAGVLSGGETGLTNQGDWTITGVANRDIDGVVRNTGTITHTESGIVFANPGTDIINEAGGVYDFGDGGRMAIDFGDTSSFTNRGIVRKSQGDGIASLRISVLNHEGGTFDIQQGTLGVGPTRSNSTAATFNVQPGAVLDVTDGVTSTYSGSYSGAGEGLVRLGGGTLVGGEDGAVFDFADDLWQWLAGNLNGGPTGLTNQGRWIITGEANRDIDGVVKNTGVVTHVDSGIVFANPATDIINEATGVYDFGDGGRMAVDFGDTSAFTNRGIVRKSQGAGNASLRISVINHEGGTFDVQQGVLGIGATRSNSTGATFNALAGAVLDLTDGVTSTYSGNYDGSGDGMVRLGSGALVGGQNGATFDFGAGLWHWLGGILNGGPTGLTNQGDWTITGVANRDLDGVVKNTGTVTHVDSGIVFANPDTDLINEATGVYDFGDGGRMAVDFGDTSAFTNRGIVRKSQGAGSASLRISVFNHEGGTFDIQQGTLGVGGTVVTSTGATFNVQDGAVLDLTDGVGSTYTGSYSGAGEGMVRLGSGTLAVGEDGATFNFADDLWQWLAGTLNGGPTGLTNLGRWLITGPDNRDLDGTVINTGTVTHTDSGIVFANPATNVINDAGGVYDFGDGGRMAVDFGNTSAFTNRGTVRKSQGVGSASLQISVFNHDGGTFDIQQGTLGVGGTTVTSTGATLNAQVGAVLDLTDGVPSTYSGSYTGAGEGMVRLGSGSLTVGEDGATFNFADDLWQWLGGILDGGATGLTNQGRWTITGPSNRDLNGTIKNTGTITHVNSGVVFANPATNFINEAAGVYDFGDGGRVAIDFGDTSAFTNRGIVRKSQGAGSASLRINVFNHEGGTFDIQQGMLGVGGGTVTSTGATLNADAGAVLDLTDGVFSTYTGNYSGSGDGSVRLNSGTLNVGAAGATFNFAGNILIWTGGTLNGGETGLTNQGQLTVTGAATRDLDGIVTNTGTIEHQDSGTVFINPNGALTNASSGVYNLEDGARLVVDFGTTSSFTNQGTLRKASGDGTATLAPNSVTNEGTVEVLAGTVIFGPFTQMSNGEINIGIGGAPASGPFGVVDVSGNATLDGSLNLSLTGGFSPATGDVYDVVQYDSRNGVFPTVTGTDLGGGKVFNLDYQADRLRLTTADALRAAELASAGGAEAIDEQDVQPLLDAAAALWAQLGVDTQTLDDVRLRIVDLDEQQLGLAAVNTIWLDVNAAGFGWFVDSTPQDHSEFEQEAGAHAGRIDLLTVLAHEMGHLLGLGHGDEDLMGELLPLGTRRLPTADDVDHLFADDHHLDDLRP